MFAGVGAVARTHPLSRSGTAACRQRITACINIVNNRVGACCSLCLTIAVSYLSGKVALTRIIGVFALFCLFSRHCARRASSAINWRRSFIGTVMLRGGGSPVRGHYRPSSPTGVVELFIANRVWAVRHRDGVAPRAFCRNRATLPPRALFRYLYYIIDNGGEASVDFSVHHIAFARAKWHRAQRMASVKIAHDACRRGSAHLRRYRSPFTSTLPSTPLCPVLPPAP